MSQKFLKLANDCDLNITDLNLDIGSCKFIVNNWDEVKITKFRKLIQAESHHDWMVLNWFEDENKRLKCQVQTWFKLQIN